MCYVKIHAACMVYLLLCCCTSVQSGIVSTSQRYRMCIVSLIGGAFEGAIALTVLCGLGRAWVHWIKQVGIACLFRTQVSFCRYG